MLLVFEDVHKEHLSFIVDLEEEVLREFCKISLNFIRKGANPKIFNGAAQKLGVAVETVQRGVEGLMFLLTEASRMMLSEIDFHDTILTLGVGEVGRAVLCEVYLGARREVRSILSASSLHLPHYHNLEWRFDVQLACRSLRHQVVPSVLLRLTTEEEGQKSHKLLTTDPGNLVHLTNKLDQALQEMKSGYCRRVARNIK